MGFCSSRERRPQDRSGTTDRLAGSTTGSTAIVAGQGNNATLLADRPTPFTRAHLRWKADKDMTEAEWKRQKDAFWDTAPSYDGRVEVWNVLRTVCETSDMSMVAAMLDAAQVTIPSRDLTDGAFDVLGNKYTVPVYCLVPPSNLITSPDGAGGPVVKSTLANDGSKDLSKSRELSSSQQTIGETAIRGNPLTVICRLSTGSDLTLTIGSEDTVQTLKKRLATAHNVAGRLRVLYLGKEVQDKQTMSGIPFNSDRRMVQVMVVPLAT